MSHVYPFPLVKTIATQGRDFINEHHIIKTHTTPIGKRKIIKQSNTQVTFSPQSLTTYTACASRGLRIERPNSMVDPPRTYFLELLVVRRCILKRVDVASMIPIDTADIVTTML